jgi:hypothetical protein
MEGTVDQDAGAMIRDGVKVLASQGVPPESEWPYTISRFREAPPPRVVAEGAAHKVLTYSRLTSGDDFRQCLASGHPFVLGFSVWPELESAAVAETGILPLPDYDEQPIGGHAVCVIGYDRNGPAGDCFETRNSWGKSFGDRGNLWVPHAIFDHPELASDAWTLRA